MFNSFACDVSNEVSTRSASFDDLQENDEHSTDTCARVQEPSLNMVGLDEYSLNYAIDIAISNRNT
jgi:hypothetical protein